MTDRTLPTRPSQLPENWLDEVRIRALRADDLIALEWEGEYRHFRRVYAQAYQRARAGNAQLWVAEGPGEGILGQLFVLLNSQVDPELADGDWRAFIHSFRVRPGYRRGGLGSRLLRHAEEDLLGRGYGLVSLNVAKANHDGQRFYAQHGYQRVGSDPGRWTYVDHEGRTQRVHEPGWRLQKTLS